MPWTTRSGLLDDFVLTITEALFAPDAAYGANITVLQLRGSTDSPDHPVLERPELISIGDGWTSYDGGKTVQHTRGAVEFTSGSHVGLIINRLLELGAGPALEQRGLEPFDARAWIGLKARWKREKLTWKGAEGSSTKEKLMPVEFLGFEGSPAAAAPVAAAAPAPAATNGAAEDAVRALAAASATHPEFVDKAMADASIRSDANLVARVVDSGPTGIYAQVKGNAAA